MIASTTAHRRSIRDGWAEGVIFISTVAIAGVLSTTCAAAQTLEIVTPESPNIKTGSDIRLTVVAHNGDVTVEDVVASVFDDAGGGEWPHRSYFSRRGRRPKRPPSWLCEPATDSTQLSAGRGSSS